jgi:hypothetical protein
MEPRSGARHYLYRTGKRLEMPHCASLSPLGSEFDVFLFAPIGEDRNGMMVSVVSALARLDVDPWEEAARLARLPGKALIERLAALIAALPDGQTAHADPRVVATRLATLLPRPRPDVARRAAASRTVMHVTLLAIVLAAQCIVGIIEIRQLRVHRDSAQVPVAGQVVAKSGK